MQEEIKDNKEAYRLFYMVKGHFASHETVLASANGYFRRLWGNHEACYHEDGFEEAFKKLLDNSK